MKKETKSTNDSEEQVALFKALADPTRLQIVKLLCHHHEPEALCVNALAGLLGITQSAVSQHLRVLRDAGLVKAERRGQFIHYYLAPGAAARCQAAMGSIFKSKKGAKLCTRRRKAARSLKS